MIFQREKKQLWRYASSNSPPAFGPQTSPQQLPHHPQLQHRLPSPISNHHHQQQFQSTSTSTKICGHCYCTGDNSSFSMICQSQQHNIQGPPLSEHSSVPCDIDSDDQTVFAQPQHLIMVSQQDLDVDEVLVTCSKGGYYYENFGDITTADASEQSSHSRNSHNSSITVTTANTTLGIDSSKEKGKHQLQTTLTGVRPHKSGNGFTAPATTSTSTSMMTSPQICSFAATAANVFRNCCGAGCLSSEPRTNSTNTTSPGTSIQRNPVNTATKNHGSCYIGQTEEVNQLHLDQQHISFTHQIISNYNYNYNTLKQQQFSLLMKKLKSHQLTTLLQAVKSFRDPNNTVFTGATCSTNGAGAQHLNCILLKRGLSMGEDPYVIVCRLFLWYDLQDADELKRLPVCTNARDPVYICCNPLHWCRIMVPDLAPPPYQPLIPNATRHEGVTTDENSRNEGNSVTASLHSINSFGDSKHDELTSDLHIQTPESFTTDGRSACSPTIWCEIAYWELAQRVGERFLAEKALVNVYSEGVRSGDPKMCLKDLANKKSVPSPESVLKTRQKIGLGLTLSQECDGVWLYNRSTSPIFLHSPTLNDCWYQVCKVLPGQCVKAFDNHRAREEFLVCPAQVSNVQTGRIDRFSIRISFAKGWGYKYCRQDITSCPCWLEVLFTRR